MALAITRSSINDYCRLCQKNLRILGVITNSVLIFDQKQQGKKNPFQRCQDLGLVLRNSEAKSVRCCTACLTIVSRLERDVAVFTKWQKNEENTNPRDQDEPNLSEAAGTTTKEDQTPVSPISSTVSEKRLHTPSKTPRTKKLRRSPPLQTAARKSLIQVKPYVVILVFIKWEIV